MRTFKTSRPDPKHIELMLKKAEEVNKKQLEVLSMNEDMLCKIEVSNHHKRTLGFRSGKF